MALRFMYITNNVEIAHIAEQAGTDRIWIDLERRGKEERQRNMNTQKSMHVPEDISRLKNVLTKSEILVRINPLYSESKKEIDDVIRRGADIIMLPMFKTADDVKRFVSYVDGRAKVQLLVETAEAAAKIDSILEVPGVDEIHIGLNDLHLAMHKVFMFELICDDTVASLCKKMKAKGIKYGFGGIARVGYGMLPAEYIIAEHYHLGSTAAILSRGFCDANIVKDPMEIEAIFVKGVRNIRLKEHEVVQYSEEQYLKNLDIIREKVSVIAANKKGKG